MELNKNLNTLSPSHYHIQDDLKTKNNPFVYRVKFNFR